jgi:type II restriction endonuclease family protein
MDTRTVWEITWQGYLQDWLPKAVDGFGPFNRRRKSNKGATGGLCRVVSFLIAIIGTPWILIHYLAFNNHNVRPQNKANKIGYWIATIIAILIDGACIVTALFIWATIVPSEDTALGIMSFTLIIPLLYAGFSKLHYLFIKSPYEPRVPTQYEEQGESEYYDYEEDSTYDRPYARGRAYAANYSNDFESGDGEAVCERFADDEVIDIDEMDGATFEHFCADLLRVNGWTDVQITPASGDHGIDITAEKDDIKWGFQCKRWNGTKVDAVAIGQTYKGKALYECDMVAVITTSTLTAQAEGEAKQLGIKVWGRGKIRQLMSKLDNADDYYLSA